MNKFIDSKNDILKLLNLRFNYINFMNTWLFTEVCIGIVLGVILIRKHLIDIIVFQGIQFIYLVTCYFAIILF